MLERLSAFTPRDGLFPIIVGVPTLTLALAQIWLDTQPRPETKEAGIREESDERFSTWIRELKGKNLCYVIAFAWTAGLALAIYLLGYYVTIPSFLLLYSKLHDRGWRSSIVLTVTVSVFLYLSFVVGFKFEFYPGLLFESLGISLF
jgi:hypothetical protein